MATERPLTHPQRALLARALAGEDRVIPERVYLGPDAFVVPARRWFVPPGCLVPTGAEHSSCLALMRRGLLAPWYGGQGGYQLTPAGRTAAGLTPAAPRA